MVSSEKIPGLLADRRHAHGFEQHRRQMTLVRKMGVLLLSIPALLLLLCAGAYLYGVEFPEKASTLPKAPHEYLSLYPTNKHLGAEDKGHRMGLAERALVSNGTHLFHPTLILVSLDGFRADYLDRGITPELLRLGKRGLRADYMIPSFPSSTFPNHYTIVTGMYPGSHGIVSNEFYDTELNDTFVYKDAKRNIESKWWEGGEPIWVTAEKQGIRAGINMWPGSTAVIHRTKPTYVLPYNDNVHPTKKTQQLLEWLDLPLENRPAFLATYMPEVDSVAHRLGPDARDVNNAISLVDTALGDLWTQLEQRNLTHIVNLMVVSDHGMAAAKTQANAIYLDGVIDLTKVRGIYNWPLGGIQPLDEADVPEMYEQLRRASVGQPWSVYLRKDIPERFHYTNKARIAPVYIIPELPYYVTTRAMDKFHARKQLELEQQDSGKKNRIIGAHGFDNLHPLMRATFVAVGPAFRSRNAPAPDIAVNLAALNATLATEAATDAARDAATNANTDADTVSIQMMNEGLQISDMNAEQDYLELVRNAVVSESDVKYQAEYDRLWGEDMMGEDRLRNIRHPPFENVELYGLMTHILGLVPAPNNGTAQFSRWWLRQ
ncbi:alkaline-phosphatase-like protein [Kickxella alabastrina]|uniref:alkaline-phosphatase-like protein n=1 Tax=Kickxella alabastrina TaxID=61397 RepID=UPI00221FBBAD|nr:alkaline-phosphatase-like protein [Kickxella alabastrina]KAI7822466.1 alkaline-phosphatase-like protein [Kickxella alabastrina]